MKTEDQQETMPMAALIEYLGPENQELAYALTSTVKSGHAPGETETMCGSFGYSPIHRERTVEHLPPGLVARSVSRKEYIGNERAEKALGDEWDRLVKIGCWDPKVVRSLRDVKAEAKRNNKEMHFGALHELCVEKGSELPEGDPNRKYKGRVVFLGDRVTDEGGNAAVFEELSSSPAALEASRFCDLYGLLPGHGEETSDGVQAYCQAQLPGGKTWISIPRHRWPQEWVDSGITDPVTPLLLALYGHPDSGGYWEAKCDTEVKEEGFKTIGLCGEWRSCYYHPEKKLFLCIYVDDFKLSGPKKELKPMWEKLEKRIVLTPPEPVLQYLGCKHHVYTVPKSRIKEFSHAPSDFSGDKEYKNEETVKILEYDMESFLQSCCDRYEELSPTPVKWKNAATPFIDEDDSQNPARRPLTAGEGLQCPWCDGVYPENCFKHVASGEANQRKAPSKFGHAPGELSATNSKQELISKLGEKEPEKPIGKFSSSAAKVIMKVFYAARVARFDLLRAIGHLARWVNKWDTGCDDGGHCGGDSSGTN